MTDDRVKKKVKVNFGFVRFVFLCIGRNNNNLKSDTNNISRVSQLKGTVGYATAIVFIVINPATTAITQNEKCFLQ